MLSPGALELNKERHISMTSRKIRQLVSQRIHIWLCGNLLLLNLTFLGGHDKTEDKTICTVIAVLILFFALSRFVLRTHAHTVHTHKL